MSFLSNAYEASAHAWSDVENNGIHAHASSLAIAGAEGIVAAGAALAAGKMTGLGRLFGFGAHAESVLPKMAMGETDAATQRFVQIETYGIKNPFAGKRLPDGTPLADFDAQYFPKLGPGGVRVFEQPILRAAERTTSPPTLTATRLADGVYTV